MKKVSVLIPLYNKEEYILQTLKSLDKSITRGEFKIEVVVVDDCSTDNSVQAVKDYEWKHADILEPIILANEENQGPAITFNKALDNSSGEIIIPLDADDMVTRFGIINRVKALESAEDIDWVAGNAIKIDSEGKVMVGEEFNNRKQIIKTNTLVGAELVDAILHYQVIIAAQVIGIKRRVFDRVRWPEFMKSSQDTGLNILLAINNAKLMLIDEYVAVYRSKKNAVGASLFSRSLISGQKPRDFEALREQIAGKISPQQLAQFQKMIDMFWNMHDEYKNYEAQNDETN